MRFQRIIAACLLPITVLFIFLLLFENRMVLPAWLQVAGRMHPLLLHFPVVLLVLYCIWVLLIPKNAIDPLVRHQVSDWLLLLSAMSAIVTALMGLFLSKEAGYDAEALLWHKWSAVSVSFIAILWYNFRHQIAKTKWVTASVALVSLAGIIFTGHQGAEITHGQNYLFAPILPDKQEQTVSIDEAVVYTHLVHPILKAKCMSCHNNKKAKGELVMESPELLLKGGKNGVLWDSTQPELGLLLHRIHLPLEKKKHMPPQGKPQLSDDEMQVLYYWIKNGADFTTKVTDLQTTDSLRMLAEKTFTHNEMVSYDFDAPDEKIIKQLNNSNRVVYPLALESPALAVDFYNKEFFNSEQLKELLKVKGQIVSLDLSRMPLKEEDLKTIGELENLRTLVLNFTPITGQTISELKKLKFLKNLSLAGTAVTKDHMAQLEGFPQLQKVSVWNTAISMSDLEAIKRQKSKIKFETGARTDTMVLKLTAPIIVNEEQIISTPVKLQLKHYINGVVIRYTTDGTEPDSIKSKLYDNNAVIANATQIKTKAFKAGWISSDVAVRYFFKSTYLPDSVQLITPPDPKYSKGGGKLLHDLDKGDLNAGSGKWLGYRNNQMEALLLFNQPVKVNRVALSTMKNIGPYIMPPALVEVWGGNDPMKLKLLGRIKPVQPLKDEPGEVIPYEVTFKETSLRYIKVIAVPVAKLPAWHPGKGDKGWVFVDEVLVN